MATPSARLSQESLSGSSPQDEKDRRKSQSQIIQERIAAKDSEFHLLWNSRLSKLGFIQSLYVKVAVLMISWHESCDDLKTKEEVCTA